MREPAKRTLTGSDLHKAPFCIHNTFISDDTREPRQECARVLMAMAILSLDDRATTFDECRGCEE